MTDSINPTERAIIELVRQKTTNELARRVPSIDQLDFRKLAFFIVQTRIDAYRQAGIKQPLVITLYECGITTKAYYAWYEKYHMLYKRYKKI